MLSYLRLRYPVFAYFGCLLLGGVVFFAWKLDPNFWTCLHWSAVTITGRGTLPDKAPWQCQVWSHIEAVLAFMVTVIWFGLAVSWVSGYWSRDRDPGPDFP
jgi:hypothetical protein